MKPSLMKELDVLDDLYSEDRPSDVNLKKLANFLGIKQNRLADALKLEESKVSKNPYAPGSASLKQWMSIFNLVIDVISASNPELSSKDVKSKMQRWLNLPRPEFDNCSPLEFMMKGKSRKVRGFLEQML